MVLDALCQVSPSTREMIKARLMELKGSPELEADGDKKLQSNGGILVCATLLSV